MYIADLELSGIRGFHGSRAAKIRFPRRADGGYGGWTVLAGRNGSGKSTVLQALALVAQGPSAAHALFRETGDWVSRGGARGAVQARIVADEVWDSWDDVPADAWLRETRDATTIPGTAAVRLVWDRVQGRGGGHTTRLRRPTTATTLARQNAAEGLGPWKETPEGWLCLGYGPYRRLDGGTVAARGAGTDRTGRLVTLFSEDSGLIEGVAWLVDQHLRSLEGHPEAQELVEAALLLLADGLLPDGHRVTTVTSDGLWVHTPQGATALRGMSDGYRSVTALVVSMIKHLYDAYGTLNLEDRDGRPAVVLPGVVLIDEIDAHLHVRWQKEIGRWLTSHFPEIQFIVTTHSPYVCQSADPGGLVRLAGPTEERPPEVVDESLYRRVVYGSGDDAVLSDLFGMSSPYSERADELRRQLANLEFRVLDGAASDEELDEYQGLSAELNSSLSARVSEVDVFQLNRGTLCQGRLDAVGQCLDTLAECGRLLKAGEQVEAAHRVRRLRRQPFADVLQELRRIAHRPTAVAVVRNPAALSALRTFYQPFVPAVGNRAEPVLHTVDCRSWQALAAKQGS